MKTRIFALLLTLCLLVGLLPMSAFAASTTPAPKSISLSSSSVTAGGSISVTMTATSTTYDAVAEYYCEALDISLGIYLPSGSDGKYKGTVYTHENLGSGTFRLEYIYFLDDNGSAQYFYSRNPAPGELELPSALLSSKFSVKGTNPDTKAPVLKTLTISPSTVSAPGKATVTVTATDNLSGVAYGDVGFYCEKTGTYCSAFIEPVSAGKLQGTAQIDTSLPAGTYLLDYVFLYDETGNSVHYAREPWNDTVSKLPSDLLSRKITIANDVPIIVQKIPYTFYGEKASVSVSPAASGNTYQWYIKNAGASKFSKSSITSSTYSAIMSEKVKDRQVYCVVTTSSGKTYTTETVTLKMAASPITQPKSVEVADGEIAKVSFTAGGDGLTYTWYFMNPGDDTFRKTTSFTGNTYSCTMNEERDGRQVYCLVGDKYGNSSATDVVTLSLAKPKYATILQQPYSVSAASGKTAKISFEAAGDGLTYTWYFKNAGESSFRKTTAFVGNTYSTTMDEARDGRQVYCVITDKYGNTATTDIATLYLRYEAKIDQQPESVTVASGEVATVSFAASGDGLTYTWYFKNPGATSFSKTTSFTGDTYSITMSNARSGRQVYCVVKDAYGNSVTTDTVTLSVKTVAKITQQPQSVSAASGKTAKVSFTAVGDGLTYTWYFKNAGESSFRKTTSFKGNSYSTTMDAARDGRQVYCVITDKYGNSVTTDTATLSLTKNTVKITAQPQSVSVASGKTAKVSFTATGDGLTYTWYFKNKGESSFRKTTSFTSNTYSSTMDAARDGRQVYCVVADQYGNTATTETVTLSMTAVSKATITQQPKSVTVAKGSVAKVSFTASGEGLTYTWYFKNAGDASFRKTTSFTSNSYSCTMDAARDGRQVYCVVADKNGNTAKTNTVTLNMQ